MNLFRSLFILLSTLGLSHTGVATSKKPAQICAQALSEESSVDPAQNLLAAGRDRNFSVYSQLMDASLGEKLKVITPWIPKLPRPTIIDVGSGTGALAHSIAASNPNAMVTGLDLAPEMVRMATENFQRSNLSFLLAAANAPFPFLADAAIYCSIVHEIYSYGGFSHATVRDALKRTFEGLSSGGRVIIRDFVKPFNASERVQLLHKKSELVPGHTFPDFARDVGRPMTLTSIQENEDSEIYDTDYASAYEYLFRTGYIANWQVELKEQFGFWTSAEAQEILESVGFRVIHSEEIRNEWIETNRLRGKLSLRDPATLTELPYPNYQIVIVGEKP